MLYSKLAEGSAGVKRAYRVCRGISLDERVERVKRSEWVERVWGSGSRPAGEAGAVYDAVLKFETAPDCDGITDAAVKKLAGLGDTRQQQCQIARNRSYPDPSSVKVRAIHVAGATATAQVPAEAGGVKVTEGGKELVETVRLVKQGGRWLISDAHTD